MVYLLYHLYFKHLAGTICLNQLFTLIRLCPTFFIRAGSSIKVVIALNGIRAAKNSPTVTYGDNVANTNGINPHVITKAFLAMALAGS